MDSKAASVEHMCETLLSSRVSVVPAICWGNTHCQPHTVLCAGQLIALRACLRSC
jgi:hypothetical protein